MWKESIKVKRITKPKTTKTKAIRPFIPKYPVLKLIILVNRPANPLENQTENNPRRTYQRN
jgi:hypothetical protein